MYRNQNYMTNRKIKEEVDKNQKDYEEPQTQEEETTPNTNNQTEENNNTTTETPKQEEDEGPTEFIVEAGKMEEEEGEF